MTSKIVKVKNGKITLPKELQKKWKRAEVLLVPSEEDDSLLVKKIQKSKVNLSDLAKQISLPLISTKEIQKEIERYRSGK